MYANPDMLRLARQKRGFRQHEAASLIGVTQPVYSRVENGVTEFRDELVSKAASVFDFPEAFFRQTEPVFGAPVSVHAMFRKQAAVSAAEVDSVVAEANLFLLHLRKLLEAADVAPRRELPRFDIEAYDDSPEHVARLLRRFWSLPRGPIRDLTLLCEQAGILVVHSHMGGASVSGMTLAAPGLPPLIMINSKYPADRQRFTLAHELAHLVMHRFPTPEMEREADRFASELLMPSEDIQPELESRKITLASLGGLKLEWRVSMASLIMKASNLKILTKNQSTYLWRQMSARGYRVSEPVAFDFPSERPTVLRDIIDVHYSGMGYGRDDLAEVLKVNVDELVSMYHSGESLSPKFTIVR